MIESLQDNEFWATVINSSANWVIAGAMVIQTILFFITFKYGLRYLDQHREKVKQEQKQSIIIECVKKIIRLKADCISYYAVFDEDIFNENDPFELEEHIRSVIQRHRGLSNLSSKIDDDFYELSAYIQILHKKELEELLDRFSKFHDFLEKKYRKISLYASDNDFSKSYEIIKELEFYRSIENPNSLINMLNRLLELFTQNLLILYHT